MPLASAVKNVSILTPCFNEEGNVQEVYERVRAQMLELATYRYEHVFIDNNSADDTLGVLKRIASLDRNVKIIANARNFGHIRSPMHAFLQTRGDAVIGIVADLQDPPELIPAMIARWEEGYAMVLCIKRTSEENRLMFWIRKKYYATIQRLSSIDTFENFTGFGLFDRKVVEAVRAFDDPYPYFRGMIAEIGLPHCEIPYDQPRRKHGVTKNRFYSLYDTAMLGITNLSQVPLRFVTLLGFSCSVLSLLVGIGYLIYKLLFWSNFSVGIAPLVIGLFFLGSVQLLSMGVLGEYIGSIQTQVRKRPYVIEKERVNFEYPRVSHARSAQRMRSSDTIVDPLEQALARAGSAETARRRQETAFREIAGTARSVVIAGCGYLGRLAYSGAKAAGLEVAAFADNNPVLWGTTIEGVPVLNPADAVSRYDHAFFVVAIYNGTPVRRQLGQLGCQRVVPYPLFFWEFWRWMPREDRLELPHRILSCENDFRAAYERLGDRRSREEFAAQIAWRCSLDYDCLSRPDASGDMYFAPDIVRLTGHEVLVDCGAFDGDSIRMFLDKTGGAFRAIYALEPDPGNRARLNRYVSSFPAESRDRICILPFGASDRAGIESFEPSGTAGSRIVERSDHSIECRRLDDLLKDAAPTYIKMDIEGAEPRALEGGTSTIRRTRPILSVCAYHKCEHLWTLPRIISAALPEYQIRLRRYAEECWETVYYAVPPERLAGGSPD